MKNVCKLIFALAAAVVAGERLKAEYQLRADIAYVEDGEAAHRLDLYFPDGYESSRPLVIWIHGGAWRRGSKDSVPVKCFLEEGWAIASVEYRLSPVAPFPAQIHDIKAAIRFLRGNARRFDLDPQRFSLMGASAGGHLAALAGLTNGVVELEGKLGDYDEVSSSVQSIVSYYGASNFETILNQSTEHGLSVRVPALKLFIGGVPADAPENAVMASPIRHVDAGDPPTLLIHGDADPQMPFEQSVELYAALRESGASARLLPIKDGKHGGPEFYDAERCAVALAFIEKAGAGDD